MLNARRCVQCRQVRSIGNPKCRSLRKRIGPGLTRLRIGTQRLQDHVVEFKRTGR